jgi:hypothetical protein
MPEEFAGKVEILDQATQVTIELDGARTLLLGSHSAMPSTLT